MSDDGARFVVGEVAFPAWDGVTLRGRLYLPVDASVSDAVPGVVMAHGFSATMDMGLPAFAERFAAVGLAVLLYDHRSLGASDGEPRQEINPWAQARDYRAALTWLGDRPEVDGERLGVWGSSFSGGEALVVAATDDRVQAVVANVPFAGLPGVDYGADTDERFASLCDAFLDASGSGLADGGGDVFGPMPVVNEGDDDGGFLGEPESAKWFLDVGRRPDSTWRNEVTLRNAFGTEPAFDPGVCVHRIAPTPLLMVVATEDRVAAADVAHAAFERAGEPKHLVEVEGHHFSPYSGVGLERAVTAAASFFVVALDAGPASEVGLADGVDGAVPVDSSGSMVDPAGRDGHGRADHGDGDGAAEPVPRRRAPRSSSALAAAMLAVGEILEPERIIDETVQVQAADDDDDRMDLDFGELPPLD